ncbi:MAG: hypothetical protein HC831_28290 [Chloroflexia bacterium]|nr:hypothetical protein [Chloroflexia bacterium]
MSDLYQTELQKSKIYNTMKLKCKEQGDAIEASVIKLVNDIVTDSCNLSKTIIKYMPEFTLHDETHLFEFY